MDEPRLNLPELTVSELSAALKRTIEDAYGYVRVRGELGKVSYHGNGHVYFDLKDDRASIAGVIWRSTAMRIKLRLEAGLEVVITGRLTTYPGRSQYQIVVDTIEPAGLGALMALLEERRKKFIAEGLFDEARKQLLPYLPNVIGVITSPTGAVIRDILHRLADRFPRHVLLWPVKVQGEGSAAEVAAAIEGFNALPERGRLPRPHLIIVARGGGSLEDLWSFNEEIVLDQVELPPGEKALLSLQLPTEFVLVVDPVTHGTQFLDVKGEPTRERQSLSVVFDKLRAPTGTLTLRPGPVRLSLENRTDTRILPGLWVAGDKLHELLGRRRPFLTAKRLLTNQVFRDLYGTNTIDADQRLKITSLTFLFTDLRGSTELYERVGDLAAFDLVRAHFQILNEIVATEAGAVVKTIGDAVMATFPTPDRAVAAALRMRDAMNRLKNGDNGRDGHDLLLKIGIHEGPCLAVVLNDRQDYFGTTVNIAARVQALADSRAILATGPVVTHPQASNLLASSGLSPVPQLRALRGIAGELPVYEIP